MASWGVSVTALPAPLLTPLVLVEPAKIMIVLAPMLAMLFCSMAFEPCPISVMAMTAATAMMTPRAESPARILLRRSALSAVRHVAGSGSNAANAASRRCRSVAGDASVGRRGRAAGRLQAEPMLRR